LADWRAIIQLLRGAGYDGPLSLHGEYTGDPALPGLLDRVKVDLAYLRRRLAD
jgi:sugar phosphate isomerase/epimerase